MRLIFNIFWDVLCQFCYQIQSQVLWLLHICLFEIQGQILWLIHCRDSFAQNTKANSVTVTSEIHLLECLKVAFCHLWLQSLMFEQKIVLVGSEKLSGNICNYIHGLDKCNTVFQNVKTVPLIRINKAHTKIS